jgi:hypothetical protein
MGGPAKGDERAMGWLFTDDSQNRVTRSLREKVRKKQDSKCKNCG